MSRPVRFSLMVVLAAGCGSSAIGPDGGGGSSGPGSGGTIGAGGRDAGSIVDAPGGFDLVAPHDVVPRDGLGGDSGATGAAGAAGSVGAAGTTGSAGRGGTTGVAGATGVAGGGAGATGTAGGGAGATGAGGAPMGGVNIRVFPGFALLLDQGPSCTQDETATGDRWCAFLSQSLTQTVSLSVVNVSQAIRGATINCASGTDPNCLRLTSAWAVDDLHATLFQGDTLTYFDSSATPYVWRPGMPFAKRLIIANPTTGDVLGCQASSKGTTVVCLRDLPPAMQTNANVIFSDILVGRADGTGNPLLTRLETAIVVNAADTDYEHFSYGFPAPGSGHEEWSSRATPTGPEILKVKQVDSAAVPATVASDVHDWDTSPDGSRWYWLTEFNGTSFAGTLQSAPFPGGASPATVLADTVQYAFPSAGQSLVTLTGAGALSGIVDPVAAPATQISIDTAVGGFLRLSRQGHVAYLKMFDNRGDTNPNNDVTDLHIRKWDASSAACVAAPTASVFYPAVAFTSDSTAGLFPQLSANMFQGLYTRLSDCSNTIVAANISGLASIGDRAVLFMDTFSDTTGNSTLRYRNVTASSLAAGTAITVSADVGSFDTSGPAPGVLIYTVNAGNAGSPGPNDGVFVRFFGP